MPSVKEAALDFVSGHPRFWRLVSQIAFLRRWFNRLFINVVTKSVPPRPHPLSLWGSAPVPGPCADYISWTGLVDRSYSGRHLPPGADVSSLPQVKSLTGLFSRGPMMTPCPKSTALFGFFAQWFTDSFLR